MAKHRRYPVKKPNKAKVKNPLERMGGKVITKKDLNRVPNKDEMDSQPLPRRWIEVQETAKAAKEAPKRTRTGKKRAKNKFFEMTAKMGFQKRPWEDEEMLANRIARAKNRALDDELIKVQAGTAGRDPKEIEADIKKLDEKERQKKLLKVAAAEKRRKLREKEERFQQSRLAKHADSDEEDVSSVDEKELDSGDEFVEVDDQESAARRVIRKGTTKHSKKKQKQPDQPETNAKKRLSSSEKSRQKKKENNSEKRRFLMLNAKEVLPFGERADAPPDFGASLRKKFTPLYSEAGKKDLLLKDMLKVENKHLYTGSKPITDPQDEVKVTAEERQRYIDAYRKLKLNQKR
ncbi:hypothetical protein M3Y97_01053600 [Aphelenchoides bicaudatus]|nr:hypothetical protein M3Y97_01053600 [Aphelenchoides bicaudatus]